MSPDVDLWSTSLDGLPRTDYLSEDDRRRAAQFVDRRLSCSWSIGRAFMRAVLGEYLRCSPVDVALDTTPHGKPYALGSDLEFSLSRTASTAVVAVARHGPIGVDIEARAPSTDLRSVATAFCSPSELAELVSMGAPNWRAVSIGAGRARRRWSRPPASD